MQHNADANSKQFQNVQKNVRAAANDFSARCVLGVGFRLHLALCLLLGLCLPVVVRAQAAPQPLTNYHTIAAGSGTSYTPVTVTGSTTTPVHGSAPGDGGLATAAAVQFNGPDALATDSIGNLYIVDTSGTIRKVDTSGNITSFAGGISLGKSTAPTCATATDVDGDGCPANETFLNAPHGIAIDPSSGDIYIAEATGNRIRKISHSTYIMTLVAGTGSKGSVNGDLATCAAPQTCSGTQASVNGPRGMAVDKHGNLYIADTTNSAVRLANFTTGQMSTVVNTSFTKATTATCTTNATATTAGAASTGSVQDIAFDNADNLYIADATCNYIYKVAEDPATHMVDSGSTISVVLGSGLSSPAQTVFTNVSGTSVVLTPSSVRVDALGNIYVGESTVNRVWFWDAATHFIHTVFGGPAPGNCYGVTSSGTAPYNGCDGPDSATLAAGKGTPGLSLDAWGNLYIADTGNFYVHKIALGTNAPVATVPSGFGNALVHFGVGDTYSSVNVSAAPDFVFTEQTCTPNTSSDNTEDCSIVVTNSNTSTSAQYEQATVTSTAGLTTAIPLTNQAYPTCQSPAAATKTVLVSGATAVSLAATLGAACSGQEGIAVAPHKVTYTVATSPANGTLSGTAPALTYTPNAGFTGTDSFTYTVTDNSTFTGQTVSYDNGTSSIVLEAASTLTSTPATVTLKPYTAPTATAQSVTVANNTATIITLAGTDSNSATLTFSIAAAPAHGMLSVISGSSVTYTPTSGYFGADSFTFTSNDGISTSTAATVSLTVLPAAPTANNQNVSVNYQTATAITLTGSGQGTLTYAIATQPTHGTLGTLSGAAVTYTPTSGYSGADSFTFTLSNAGGTSTGQINITVGAAPIVPVAQNSSATVVYNTATIIMAIAGGGNGHALTYSVATAPAHGTVSAFTGANITYTPTSGYSGADSFTFTASDGSNTSNAASISITVTQPPPVANNQSVTTAFGTALPITLTASGNGTITYSIVATPAHGTLTGTAPNVTYTPSSNYVGADSFTFQASNGAASNVATVSITVSAPPAPTPTNQTVNTAYQTAKAITLSATGSGTITFAVATQPSHGTLTGTAPSVIYTPATGFFGADSFTFTATNPGGSATGTITLNVAPPPPVAQNVTATVANGTPTPITLLATGGGTLTYAVVTAPVHGSYTLSGAVVTYTPANGYVGSDSFTFTASNGSLSNVAIVSITVNPAPPVANSAMVNASFNTPTTISLTATGIGALTYQIVTAPAHGTLSGTAPAVTYTPTAGYSGADSFTFTASNAGGASNLATISIAVGQGFIWTGSSLTASVHAGQTATYNLMLSGWTGSTGAVSFTCSGAAIACNVSPNPAMLNGTASIPVTVSIVTTVMPPSSAGLVLGHTGSWGWRVSLSVALCLLLLPLRRRRIVLLGVVSLIAVLGISGCGSVTQLPFGTANGTYIFSVVAASGTATAGNTETLTLIVN